MGCVAMKFSLCVNYQDDGGPHFEHLKTYPEIGEASDAAEHEMRLDGSILDVVVWEGMWGSSGRRPRVRIFRSAGGRIERKLLS
jgi:hypothetical protein